MSIKTINSVSIAFLIIGLIVGVGGGYFYTSNLLQPQIDELEEQVIDLSSQISSHSTTITSLETEIDGLENQIQGLESEISTLESIKEDLESQNQDFESEISTLEGIKEDLESQIVLARALFIIGVEDESWREFRNDGFEGQNVYSCVVGVNCSADNFPHYLHIFPDDPYYDQRGVMRIVISFTLDKLERDVVLRLARGGLETTEVTVDGGEKYLVTASMLGSNEGFIVGSYDLEIGSLEKGSHTIELAVAMDGKGGGSYEWDALVLYTSPP